MKEGFIRKDKERSGESLMYTCHVRFEVLFLHICLRYGLLKMLQSLLIIQETHEPELKIVHSDDLQVLL